MKGKVPHVSHPRTHASTPSRSHHSERGGASEVKEAPITFYGTMTCGRCYKLALIVLGVGADGYRLDRVESNCKHIPEKAVENGDNG
jgi:hypothetical protein